MSEGDKKEVLSQDEVDSLLTGLSDDEINIATSDENLSDNQIRYYDFAAQGRSVSGRLSGLLSINERFIRNFRTSLMGLLRRSVEITVVDIDTIKCSEYFCSLETPSCINLFRLRPLHGVAMCMIGKKLVRGFVDSLFGGVLEPNIRKRSVDFTQMELRISSVVLEHLYGDLETAWNPIIPAKIEQQGFEVNPSLLNFASQNEMIVIKKFKIEIENLSDEVHIGIPYSLIEPIRASLEVGAQGETIEVNERWLNDLREEIFDALINISGELAHSRMNLSDLVKMKAGDLIPIEMHPFVTVLAEGIPTFRAKYGVSNGKCAIKIMTRASRE